MISTNLRYFIIATLYGYSLYLLYTAGLGAAWFSFLATFIVIAGHLGTGTVWPASKQLSAGNFEEAERLLKQIKKPNWLMRYYKSNYHFMMGIIKLAKKEYAEGDRLLKRSLEIGLKSENSRALAFLNLAHSSFLQGQYQESKAYLNKGQALEADLHVLKKMEELEGVLAGKAN